jgi:hypothetical protein
MNLHTFQVSLFRDKTRLRYIQDGRLIIKSEVSSMLDLNNRTNLFYCIKKVDVKKRKLEFLLSTVKHDKSIELRLESIKGNRILKIKNEILKYAFFKSQYAKYYFLDSNCICVELNYEI